MQMGWTKTLDNRTGRRQWLFQLPLEGARVPYHILRNIDLTLDASRPVGQMNNIISILKKVEAPSAGCRKTIT